MTRTREMPMMPPAAMFSFDNIQDAEEVYQRCVLITGRCSKFTSDNAFIEVETRNKGDQTTFPNQRWPMCQGYFRALVNLTPGRNYLFFKAENTQGTCEAQGKLFVDYTPILNAPPLHLAIMVAKDSPLLIDCPPSKHSFISSTHSSLNAAIAKFRTTALMWQALTAEDLRAAGLGRRSFRLEEEWGADTLTQDAARDGHATVNMGSRIKIHVVKTNWTVREIRDKEFAQQNPVGGKRNELHAVFKKALRDHGAPFLGEDKPVVAGMILDSAYDSAANMIMGHAALGAHDPNGLSLGIFGSHLTYAWPRFFEEIADCLLDMAVPGDSVGNDNGECTTMWEACTVGQGAFLHEVGHAFARPHTKGIMTRGYSRDWAQVFLAKTAKSMRTGMKGLGPVTPDTKHDCHWDISDMIRFINFPHFRIPTDGAPYSPEAPTVELKDDEEDFLRVAVSCKAGFARVILNGKTLTTTNIETPATSLSFVVDELEDEHDREKPLKLDLLCMNGKEATYNLWNFLNSKSWIKVPGSNVRLLKKSVGNSKSQGQWPWAVMLRKRNASGALVNANKIDIRVGCGLDGAVVHYKDGTTIPCGPRGKNGRDPDMGGHQAKKLALPKGVEVTKVAVCRSGDASDGNLEGLRIWLSNGKAMGALNKDSYGGKTVDFLEPEAGHGIIGFYGVSGAYGMANEFGIVTAPKDKVLPDSMYDIPELQNNPKGGSAGRSSKRRKLSHDEPESGTEDEETDISEDEDTGYDDDYMNEGEDPMEE